MEQGTETGTDPSPSSGNGKPPEPEELTGRARSLANLRPPWRPGQSGNPGGGIRTKHMRERLEKMLLADDGEKLMAAVRETFQLAMGNGASPKLQQWALQTLWDRMDGPLERILAGPGRGAEADGLGPLQVEVVLSEASQRD